MLAEASSESPVRPCDCAIIVAIPLDEETFLRQLAKNDGYIAELAAEAGWSPRTGRASWRIYENRIAAPVLRSLDAVRRRGTTARRAGTLADVRDLCTLHRVVTLFAHCDADASPATVELADGVWTVDDVAEAVPPDFAGVLDLALCHSWVVGEGVKRARPSCLVTMNAERLLPGYRARFYQGVIDVLDLGPRRFTDAAIDLAKELIK